MTIALVPETRRSVAVIAESVPNTGTYDWMVPRGQAGGRYTIAIRNSDGAEGESALFVIRGLPTLPRADHPPPNVTSFGPTDRGYVNLTITFNGRDFVPAYFAARVGAQPLEIISRATNKIEAKLPSHAMTGDLVVSHGTPASEYVLAANYRVAGDAVISDAQPRAITRGTMVTITGTDLWNTYPYNWGANNTLAGYVGLGNSTSALNSTEFVYVSEWKVGDDGTTATFRVFDVWNAGATGQMTRANPQPASLSGTLRLVKIGTNTLVVAGPPLTWTLPSMSVASIDPPDWGTEKVNFVLIPRDGSMRVSFTGIGLNASRASLGNTALLTSVSEHGANGWFEVPYHAVTDYVVFSKDGESVQSPQRLVVVPGPRMRDTATTALSIAIDTSFVIAGWDLAPPAGVPLSYTIRLTRDATQLANCKLQFSVVSLAANAITVRFSSMPGGVPASCLGPSSATSGQMVLFAELGGRQTELWRRAYYLTP